MNNRYVILTAGDTGFEPEFDYKFSFNTYFVSHFLSTQIRKQKIPTDGTFNMIYCNITKGPDRFKMFESTKVAEAHVHLSDKEKSDYEHMLDETERFEFYLALLERGYRIIAEHKDIPMEALLSLHQSFREGGYQARWPFKKKRIREYGIDISLNCVLTSYDFKLMLTVYDLHQNQLGEGCIYHTYPDSIFFGKCVRHLVVTEDKVVITDFLDYPRFECDLRLLAQGIVESVCVDSDTQKYIYSEDTKKDFERLKW